MVGLCASRKIDPVFRVAFSGLFFLSTITSHAQIMAMGLTSRMSLLELKEVRRELKLTAQEESRLREAVRDLRALPDQEGVNDMQHPYRSVDRGLQNVLTKVQRKRLDQLFLQENGLMSLSEPEVVALLALPKEKQDRATELIDELMSNVMTHLAEVPQGGQWDRKKVAGYKREAQQKLEGLLSQEERKRWESLKGAPFKFPRSMRPNG